MRIPATLALILTIAFTTAAQAALPVYLWYEPEWFEGVSGSFGYWSGFDSSKPKGSWGIAGPGIAAEFTQGGESEWNSMGVPAAETSATAQRKITIPRAGKYRVWVRYYDHRDLTEPFTIRVEQSGKTVAGELGVKPIVPRNDEYQLYWGFSFGWGSVDGQLDAGPATLKVVVDKAGQAFRQVDAVLLGVDVQLESDPAALSARVEDAERVALALAELARSGVGVANFALGQPSLDEVFLALTGRPATEDETNTEDAA